jgi:Phage integrase family
MRRPSELCELRVKHVRPYAMGLKVFLARSKTDQTMEGRWLHVDRVEGSPTCPVHLLGVYLASRGKLDPEAPLFCSSTGKRMSCSSISSVVKHMCKEAGCEDKVSGHSLWIAGATLAVKGGLSIAEICAIGGWKSEAVLRYLRDSAVAEKGGSRLMGFWAFLEVPYIPFPVFLPSFLPLFPFQGASKMRPSGEEPATNREGSFCQVWQNPLGEGEISLSEKGYGSPI